MSMRRIQFLFKNITNQLFGCNKKMSFQKRINDNSNLKEKQTEFGEHTIDMSKLKLNKPT